MKTGPAYEVLEKLAERPCGIRRCDGDNWDTIEKDLEVVMTTEDVFVTKLTEIIDLRLVDQCKNENEWTKEVVSLLNKNDDRVTDDRIHKFIEVKKNDGEMVWLDRIGSMSLI
jgi:DNA polymerase III delta prime subunit